MIEQIEEFFSNKNLRVWCRLQRNWDNAIIVWMSWWYWYDVYSENRLYECQSICWYDDYSDDWIDDWIYKIIWHKVMIWDVLDWIDEKLFWDICENCEKCGKKLESVQHYYEAWGNIDDYDRLECEEHGEQDCLYTWEQYIIIMRKELRKPIEDQSDECIDFVYSLIG